MEITEVMPDQGDGLRRIRKNGIVYFSMADVCRWLKSKDCSYAAQLLSLFRREYPGIGAIKASAKGVHYGWFCPDHADGILSRYIDDPDANRRAYKLHGAIIGMIMNKNRKKNGSIVPAFSPVSAVSPFLTAPVIAPVLVVPKPVRIIATNIKWIDRGGLDYRGMNILVTGITGAIKGLAGNDNFVSLSDIVDATGRKAWRVREKIVRSFPADIVQGHEVGKKSWMKFIRHNRIPDALTYLHEGMNRSAEADKMISLMESTLIRKAA